MLADIWFPDLYVGRRRHLKARALPVLGLKRNLSRANVNRLAYSELDVKRHVLPERQITTLLVIAHLRQRDFELETAEFIQFREFAAGVVFAGGRHMR